MNALLPFAFGALLGLLAGALLGRALAAGRRAGEGRDAIDSLAHDLRGPLTVIRGEVEMTLSRDDADPGERGRSCDDVIGAVEEMADAVHRYRSGGPAPSRRRGSGP